MRIIALSTLKAFWEENPEYQDAKEPTLAWHRHTFHADWSSPAEVKQDFRNASILKDGRVVFNIAGNKYRLVVCAHSGDSDHLFWLYSITHSSQRDELMVSL